MANIARKTFTGDSTWIVPAGVKQVKVMGFRRKTYIAPYTYEYTSIPANGGSQVNLSLGQGGKAWAWGLNANGQLGDGTVVSKSSPVTVTGGLAFTQVYTDGQTSYGLTISGNSYAWGSNNSGQVGDGTSAAKSSPVLISGGLSFTKIVPCSGSVFALDQAGNMWSWGDNTNGQLGDGTTTKKSSPVKVLGGLTFEDIFPAGSAGSNLSVFGFTYSGVGGYGLYGWGDNTWGQLGQDPDGSTPNTTPKSSPVLISAGVAISPLRPPAFAVSGGGSGICWLLWDGTNVWGCGGVNGGGVLGVNDTSNHDSPVTTIRSFTDVTSIFMAQDGSASWIIDGGTMYSSGSNVNGMLGVGDVTSRSSHTLVVGGFTNWALVTSEGNGRVGATIGLLSDGRLYGWGGNNNGQLGIGSTTNKSSPTLVVGSIAWRFAQTTVNCSEGVDRFGNVYGWGANTNGQIGDGTRTSRSSPVLVSGGVVSDTLDNTFNTWVTVTPGSTYEITLGRANAYLGLVAAGGVQYTIGQGPLDQVVLEYES